MTTSRTASGSPTQAEYVSAIQRHLKQEERLLVESVTYGRQLRPALLERDPVRLLELTRHLAKIQESFTAIAAQRTQVKHIIAHLLSTTNATPNLASLVANLPEELASGLQASRQRLLELGSEARQIHVQNVTVASHMGAIVQRVLESITGQTSLQCYGPKGELQSSSVGSMLQTEF